jgi:hypothetical protein
MEGNMRHTRILTICAIGILCSTRALEGEGLSQYRNFEMGSGLAAVSTITGVAMSEAKVVHQRPAVMRDLEWRPSRWIVGSTETSTDPVERIRFSFYNDQLFRLVVEYGYENTEGMTGADLIAAISNVYGAPLPPASRTARPPAARSRVEADWGSPLARWGDTEHAAALYQTSSYGSPYRLVVTDVDLDTLARQAEAQALRLDEQEAPAQEVARQKKAQEDARAAAAKARAANKAVFRP